MKEINYNLITQGIKSIELQFNIYQLAVNGSKVLNPDKEEECLRRDIETLKTYVEWANKEE